ncbi:MAG TPA: hypothetical protein VM639_14030 [Dongiaceae bacterium]|nr:hypothetical protein [Dongiaceae bacterium]
MRLRLIRYRAKAGFFPGKARPSSPLTAMLLMLVAAGTLSGCAADMPSKMGYRRQLDSWIGSTGAELTAQWGAPSNIEESLDGTKHYTYKESRTYRLYGGTRREEVLVDGHYVDVDIPQPDKIGTTWCDTTFHLSATYIIQSYEFVGPDCTNDEKPAN